MPTKKKAGAQRAQAMKIGAGIAAGMAGALAGAYLLYERTRPQQKKAKAWVMKARKEAALEAQKLARIGEAEYQRIVEKAMKHYGAMEHIGGSEIASAIRDAKAEWKHIQSAAKEAAKPAVKKAAKKVVKKAALQRPARKVAKKKKTVRRK
jgi:hypothetical protein